MLPYDDLPALARPLIDRLLTTAARDERIVGVTVGGSAATRTMDESSDLDLVIVCRDGAVRDAMAPTAAEWPAPGGQWIEDRFWIWVHYGATKIGRGELFECLELLALLRSAALGPMIAREHAQRPQGVSYTTSIG